MVASSSSTTSSNSSNSRLQQQHLQPQQPAQQSGKKPHRTLGQKVQTLAATRLLLSEQDPDCLFVVRRIQKLGFGASRKLKAHYKNYGRVVRVWISHSVGQHGDFHSIQVRRRRPCNLGFVHMETAAAVLRVLAEGEEQQVDGFLIQVQRFQRQIGDSMVQFQLSEVDEETEFKDEVDCNTPDSESTEKAECKTPDSEVAEKVSENGQQVDCKTPDSDSTDKVYCKTPDSEVNEKVDWKNPESEVNDKVERKALDSKATDKVCNECCRRLSKQY